MTCNIRQRISVDIWDISQKFISFTDGCPLLYVGNTFIFAPCTATAQSRCPDSQAFSTNELYKCKYIFRFFACSALLYSHYNYFCTMADISRTFSYKRVIHFCTCTYFRMYKIVYKIWQFVLYVHVHFVCTLQLNYSYTVLYMYIFCVHYNSITLIHFCTCTFFHVHFNPITPIQFST